MFESRNGSVQAFAEHRFWGVDAIARASYALGTYELSRETGLPGLIAEAEFDTRTFGAGLALRQSFSLGPVRMSWESRADYMQTRLGKTEERGADGLALAYNKQTHEQLVLADDLEMRFTAYQSDRLVLAPFAGVTISDRVLGRRHALTSRLIDNSAQAAITSSGLSSRLGAQVRLDWRPRSMTSGSSASAMNGLWPGMTATARSPGFPSQRSSDLDA